MVLDVLVVGFVLVIWALYALNQKLSDMRSDVKTVKDAAKKWLEKIEREEAADRQARFFEKQAEWDREYDEEAKRRRDTPGCRETRRGVGLRYVLPGEPDYQYSVPLGDSTQAHLVLINAGFVYTMKDDGVGGVRENSRAGRVDQGRPCSYDRAGRNCRRDVSEHGFFDAGVCKQDGTRGFDPRGGRAHSRKRAAPHRLPSRRSRA
jgi:hypothetical protein